MSKRKKDPWKISGLRNRVQQLIREGVLAEGGPAKICQMINAEFAEAMADGRKLTQKALSAHIPGLVWTQEVERDLWNSISNNMLEKFRGAYAYIPEKMVKSKVRSLKGVTHSKSVASFKAGMGRLDADDLPWDVGKYEFPTISYKKPFQISEAAEGRIRILNGALIGIKHTDIVRNALRRALADSRKSGASAVIISNIIELWTKKTAGPLAAHRAMVSGIQVNPERFPEEYREEVKKILSGEIKDKLIYQSLDARFREILDGLHKITHRPDGSPEFTGPVYVVLGVKEEELIIAGAYYQCRYMTIEEQNRIQAELNMANHRLEKAKKDKNAREEQRWSLQVKRLVARQSWTIITNTADPLYEFYRRRMRAMVVKRLEATIPNCKVLSQGSTHLKVEDKIIKIHVPPHDKVTDGLLGDYADNYGAEVFRNTLADLTVICHPYPLNHRLVGREDSRDGQPVTKFITVAPSCLDGEYLREVLKDSSKSAHPVQHLVFDPQFKPGVLEVSWANGILSTASLPIPMLSGVEAGKDIRNYAFPYPKIKYITWFLNSDNHFGSPAKRFIWDPKQKVHLGVTEAAIEMMRRLGVLNTSDIRVHCSAEMDDATNGDLWFKPRYRPDPKLVPIIHMERWLQEMAGNIEQAAERGDTETVKRLTEEVRKVSIAQLYLKGEDFPFHQMMQVFDRHLDPQIDFFNAVLGRFVKSKLEILGVSKISRIMSDTRDLGVVNFPEGNHRINTLEQADLEGDYLAIHLQNRLGQLAVWQKYAKEHPDFLQTAIRAPRFGNVTFGWGTIQAPGGYRWGVRVHASPARQTGWSDILAAVVKSDLQRGDDTYGLLKHVTVTFFGDRHFAAEAETERMIYVMCPAGVHTDIYGSVGGFPPNNTGVCFVSIPTDGPDSGPILVRYLTHDFLRDWFANPKPFAWEKFLPEPA